MDIENLTKTELIQLRDKINATLMIRGDAERAEESSELQKHVGKYFKYEAKDLLNLYATRELDRYGHFTSDVIYLETEEAFHEGIAITLRDLYDFEEVTKDEWEAAKKKLIEHTVKQLEKL